MSLSTHSVHLCLWVARKIVSITILGLVSKSTNSGGVVSPLPTFRVVAPFSSTRREHHRRLHFSSLSRNFPLSPDVSLRVAKRSHPCKYCSSGTKSLSRIDLHGTSSSNFSRSLSTFEVPPFDSVNRFVQLTNSQKLNLEEPSILPNASFTSSSTFASKTRSGRISLVRGTVRPVYCFSSFFQSTSSLPLYLHSIVAILVSLSGAYIP
mmetsp:Transcript_24278/g.39382  ORF Transcript_24278/g.39382 Transcript_24278/m.39382 type:complete len:208 (+) Transcript_24278:2055-2678(+)